MTTTTTTYAELVDRARAGDPTVTAKQLTEARAADELAEHQAEAERRRLEADAAAELERRREAVRAEYITPALEAGLAVATAYARAVAALQVLERAVQVANARRSAAFNPAKAAGIDGEARQIRGFKIEDIRKHALAEGKGTPIASPMAWVECPDGITRWRHTGQPTIFEWMRADHIEVVAALVDEFSRS
jgi:hypothetical protein